ncbi:uncharacterized protein LOC124795722 [Schistocerca piceifrons]|uniref:uncharacterized protein LOC124795722 n=1 Tax=Schistocerca piceifrons TaxID=274613 RepID=UPI001F5E89DD|nr:uncharacterized protein LOC124795722 [Schistocerca piceifrons]
MELLDPLLHNGRTLYRDNSYSSVSLATELMNTSTHLVGTLRSNRKGNPQTVISAKLKKGQTICSHSNTKTSVIKWKDKQDVLMISTKHNDDMVPVKCKTGMEVLKPKAVDDYNAAKSFITATDQLSSFSMTRQCMVKWYRKIIFEILFGTSVVNAQVLYNLANKGSKSCIQIIHFRELLVLLLLNAKDPHP